MEDEPHYIIDALTTEPPSEYLTEYGITDPRLIKVYMGEGEYKVIRPPSLEPQRRLDFPNESYTEIEKNFRYLLGELSEFDIKVPKFDMFVSEIHTAEGQKGHGLCIASEYIHGKCLPMENTNGLWDTNKSLFYSNMNKWLNSITQYMTYKYLIKEDSPKFLTDATRPVQFVYAFDDKQIYLVDLDPLYGNILNEDGSINERYLICLTTLNSVRNKYFNKGYEEGYIDKKWGREAERNIKNLIMKTDIQERVPNTSQAQLIMKNLLKRV